MTGIEWTDETWNPVTGCDKVSPGCAHCYAEAITRRFPKAFPNGFQVTLHPDRLEKPYHWRKPRRVFVNSMSDLFHERVPTRFIKSVMEVIHATPQHTYQILTKREERLAHLVLSGELQWPDNLWMGVSVESQAYTRRIKALQMVPTWRFLSCEPLLGPLDLREFLDPSEPYRIHWVIVGGESGSGFRPPKAEWIRAIRDQCESAGVPFFFKQWGGTTPKAHGATLDGKTYQNFPT